MSDTKNGKATLAEAVKYLIHTIKAHVDAQAIYKDADQRVKTSGAWQAFAKAKDERALAKRNIDNADADVRRLALEIHAELGEKNAASGVQVIDKSTFEILDFDAAVAWCDENLPIAVIRTVDKALVEVATELMSEDKRPDFVKFETVQAVRISKGKLELEEEIVIEEIGEDEIPF